MSILYINASTNMSSRPTQANFRHCLPARAFMFLLNIAFNVLRTCIQAKRTIEAVA